MSRSNFISYFLVPLVAVTLVVVWIGFSGSTTSPQVKQSTEPAQQAQPALHWKPAPAVFNAMSLVRPVHHGPNHPPVVNDPVYDRSRVVQFPAGPGTELEFEGDPASDYEKDVITYRFGIAIPGRLGIRSPEEALLCVDRYGSRFIIRPRSSVTPAEFASVYGNVGIVPVLPAVIFASDGKSEGKPVLFNLSLVYDASTGNTSHSESMGGYFEENTEPANQLERASDSFVITLADLKKVAAVSRVWRLDPPLPFSGTVRPFQTTR
ncbi:MAG: hypothetical protein F4014_05100 [Gemmatimonadetes bacterium]|nr:hypothetical protein [Gemmatimonadota bacterium]MYH18105.1 hypothetical protein [Gemmatimonadota bacterium]MYK98192.1 hypothetical protein [Gemmatimonadota bacterium]